MSASTGIEWTDATWNPTEGCSMAPGSELKGCLRCYAARTALRRPESGLAVMRDSGPRWTGKVQLVESRLDAPLHWRAPKRIFVDSMSDLFHEKLSDEVIDRVFAVMSLCPQHTFQVLTKRPERMLEYFQTIPLGGRDGASDSRQYRVALAVEDAYDHARREPVKYPGIKWPLLNVWLGVSVEDQTTADVRIPLLLQTPAAKRFVSYEPALGPVDFRSYFPCTHEPGGCDTCRDWEVSHGLDQIIVGGESGPGARPFDIAWARDTIAQCREAGVACFVKQLGARPYPGSLGSGRMPDMALKDRKGGDPSEWPEDLRVREFPS